MRRIALSVLLALIVLSGCTANQSGAGGEGDPSAQGTSAVEHEGGEAAPAALPAPTPGCDTDATINQETIDDWLGREDVVYRDMRMFYDSADFESLGGDSLLSRTLEGFKVVPFPFLATLPALPVEGAYRGPTLYAVTWTEEGTIASVSANYEESDQIINDLFPKDKAIFLMCGAGKYAGFTKELLIALDWDAEKLYNIGGNWDYLGNRSIELAVPSASGSDAIIATWRVDYVVIDFEHLHPLP